MKSAAILLLLTFLLVACGGSEPAEAPPVDTPTALPEAPTATIVEEPVAVVEEHAEEAVATLVPPPTTPTPTPAPVVEGPARLGLLHFSDEQVHSDKATLQMTGVAPLADNSVYEAWLVGDSNPPLSLGRLSLVDGTIDHTFVDPEGRRLPDLYNAMFISVEPADDNDPAPSGVVAYRGEIPAAVMAHIRQIITTSPDSPDGDGLALNSLASALRVLQLAEAQQQYATANDLVNLRAHAENMINIIEGAAGPNYGDVDGDGQVFTDDGFGMLRFGDSGGYLQATIDRAALASETEGASAEVALHAEHVKIAAENAAGWAGIIRDLELNIIQAANTAEAADLVTGVIDLAQALVEGIDANGDGQVAPEPGEGGTLTMYQHGQLMAGIEIFAETAGPETAPAATPTAELISEHDGDTAEIAEPEFTGEAALAEWQQLTPANAGPGPRFDHGLQYHAATNQVFLFGGQDGSQDYNDVWALNLNDLSWRQLAVNSPVAPPARHSMVMIVDEAGQNLYVSVGQRSGEVLNDIWRLDLATETWEDLSGTAGTAPQARYGSPGGNVGGSLLVTHGFGTTRYDDTWLFNTSRGQWQNITPGGELPLKRCLFAATVSGGNLVIHGGCASGFGDCFLDDAWVLDTTAPAWRQISSEIRPVGRQHHSLVSMPNQNQVILFGGEDASRTARSDIWLLDLAAESWQPVEAAAGPESRYNHAAVWVSAAGDRPAGMLVYGGRLDRSRATADLWLLSFEGPSTGTAAPTPIPELISEHDGE